MILTNSFNNFALNVILIPAYVFFVFINRTKIEINFFEKVVELQQDNFLNGHNVFFKKIYFDFSSVDEYEKHKQELESRFFKAKNCQRNSSVSVLYASKY